MAQIRYVLGILFVSFIAAACSKSVNNPSLGSGEALDAEVLAQNQNRIRFLDESGQGISELKVMIGPKEGQPFANNTFTTDAQGSIQIPSGWTSALPVTVSSARHIQTSYDSVTPVPAAFIVHELDGREKIEVKGIADGFGNLRRDGKVDFALVMPALSRKQILSFDVSTVLSPENDSLRILGRELLVPSNLSLPKQSETYVLPITLDKPVFRIFTRNPGQYKMIAAHGQFPLQRVVDEIRNGKSIFDVINHFTFVGGGLKTIVAGDKDANNDISVDQMKFNKELTLKPPQIPEGKEVLALALAENEGLLYPTDVKRVVPGQTLRLVSSEASVARFKLSLLTDAAPKMVLSDLFEPSLDSSEGPNPLVFIQKKSSNSALQDLSQVSFVLQVGDDPEEAKFLSPVPKPVITKESISMEAPAAIEGVIPAGTYLVLSEIQKFQGEQGVVVEQRTRLWEIFSKTWTNQIQLPEVALSLDPSKSYRWEVLFLGRDNTSDENLGDPLNSVTHVSRNAFDF